MRLGRVDGPALEIMGLRPRQIDGRCPTGIGIVPVARAAGLIIPYRLPSYIRYMYISPSGRLRFEWDSAKAIRNLLKHGVAFAEARSVFSDDHAILLDDPDAAHDEERLVLLGLSSALRLLVVVHCYRDADRTIRLISARKATRSERAQYDARPRS